MPKKERVFYILVSCALAFALFILSIIVNRDIFRNVDFDVMVKLQSFISHRLDIPFSLITLLGSSEITLIVLLVILIFILITRRHFFLGLLLFAFIFMFELAGKIYIYHPMPPKIFYRYALKIHFPIGSIINTHFSFPSGHMARTAFLAVILTFLIFKSKISRNYKILISLLLGLYIMLVFVSRIYLGEHWLSDVLGGFILGAGVAALSLSLW